MQARWSHETLTEIWPCSPLPSIGKEEGTARFLHRAMVKKKLESLQGLHKLNMFTNPSPGNLSRSSCPRREGLQLRSSGAGYGIRPFPMTWLRPSCQGAPSCLQVEGSGKTGGSQPEGERDFSCCCSQLSVRANYTLQLLETYHRHREEWRRRVELNQQRNYEETQLFW